MEEKAEEMMLPEITAGISGLKNARDLIKSLGSAKTDAAVAQVQIDLQNVILDAQQALFAANEAQSTLTQRVHDLEQELMSLKDWNAEADRYELTQIEGALSAYVLKKGMEGRQEPHWLCANCFQDKHKSFLQQVGPEIMRSLTWMCANRSCGTQSRLSPGVNPTTFPPRD